MNTRRSILLGNLLALLSLACACPVAGLLGRTATPTPLPPTQMRAAPTATRVFTAMPVYTATLTTVTPTQEAQPTQPLPTSQPDATQIATQPPEQEPPGEDAVLEAGQLTGRYQEAWSSCASDMQDWREGLVFELYLNSEGELLVREIPDTGNEYDPPVYIPGYTLDFFVFGGEAHPDRFLYYTFTVMTPERLEGWLEEDAGGNCEIVWTRLP
ncbi:MAG: hypothetical protein HPY76_00355 [Anaerolineae bacterium]|nr:hypothetical protein [Anaerolineae bacterium]